MFGFNNKPEQVKSSYKLVTHIEPHWFKILQKIVDKESNETLKKKIEEYLNGKIDYENTIVNRRYFFEEYYDAYSGLTIKNQRTILQDGKQLYFSVDEFGDLGRLIPEFEGFEYDELNKYVVKVEEDFIWNNIYEKYGGRKIFPEKEDILFNFPQQKIFEFLYVLGSRFHETEQSTIIKWPINIQDEFNKLGIKYELYNEFTPQLFDIRSHDPEFFEKIGKPEVASLSSEKGFLSQDGTYFGVSLKLFRPNENPRLV